MTTQFMSMAAFINEHRGELDEYIRAAVSNPNFDIDDDEREQWIVNDEGLYRWALECGVDVYDEEDDDD